MSTLFKAILCPMNLHWWDKSWFWLLRGDLRRCANCGICYEVGDERE